MFKGKHKLFRAVDFHESTLLHRKGASLFESLSNMFTGECIQFVETENTASQKNLDKPLLLSSMPGYMKGQYVRGGSLKVKTIKTFPGSLINLKAYPNYRSYLDMRFTGKQRAQFRSSKALLHHCFEIVHRVYFGAIDKPEYNRLFETLKEMHLARLAHKGCTDDTAGMWALYQASAYQQILDQEACLSVVYHGDRPIAISLNFILGKVVHGFNRSFDMAYSKFGLGTIELLNMVEWCFGQGFEILDFMKGEYNYKNKFTDTPYCFTLQLVFGNNVWWTKLKGLSLYYSLSIFYILYNVIRSVGLLKLWHTLSKPRNIKPQLNGQVHLRELEHTEQGPLEHDSFMVDWSEIACPNLRKAICNFCHKNKKPLKSINLFSLSETPSTIILMEGSQMLLIMGNKDQNFRKSKL